MYPDKRFWEVDFLRGTAVILMVFYHFAYDLLYFKSVKVFEGEAFWFVFPRIIAGTFILLVGVSLSLSRMRDPGKRFSSYFRRGAGIFMLGMVITAVTYFFAPNVFIVFGVLHFIGVATILSYFFLEQGRNNLLFALVAIVLGVFLSQQEYGFPYLLWLGFTPTGFTTLDYFPLLPWFGLVLIGIYLGEKLYQNNRRRIYLPELGGKPVVEYVCFFGRNSLLIYFLHQPLILSGLFFLGGLT